MATQLVSNLEENTSSELSFFQSANWSSSIKEPFLNLEISIISLGSLTTLTISWKISSINLLLYTRAYKNAIDNSLRPCFRTKYSIFYLCTTLLRSDLLGQQQCKGPKEELYSQCNKEKNKFMNSKRPSKIFSFWLSSSKTLGIEVVYACRIWRRT